MPAGLTAQKQTFSIAIICGGVILLFYLITIVPNRTLMQELDAAYSKAQSDLQDQALLAPLFKSLLGRISAADPGELTLPELKPIARGGVIALSGDLESLAGKTGLAMDSFTPDFSTPSGSTPGMKISVRVSGAFLNFRDFLLDLVRSPYIQQVERVHLETGTNKKSMEVIFRIAEKQSS